MIPYITVPTWENGLWSETIFDTLEDFRDFILPLFKEPGQYEFDETIYEFNSQGRHFRDYNVYCLAPDNTKDYRSYWDNHKNKCRVGCIFKNNGKTWFITRDYYMWLNFLPIFDKMKKKFGFAEIWDTQYHISLYEILAELHFKHIAGLKKRQICWSYFHCAKMINQLWFEEGVTMKMGASKKDYINEKGEWKFLNEYAKFLNEYTAWYRPLNPDKVLMWQQKIENIVGGKKIEKGLKGVIQGLTLDKNPTAGCGGPCTYFYYVEGGIAPTADDTYGFMKPALEMGELTTGTFIIGGAVGDLDQCEPLKNYVYNPDANQFYSVESNLLDNNGTIGRTALFIPEQWSMPPYIDKFGNSLVKEALAALDKKFERIKKELSPEAYQLEISQHPRSIAEAFAHRKVSIFPTHLLAAQSKRIEEKEYPYQLIELSRDATGKIVHKESSKTPIKDFPISRKMEDKEGVIVMHEKPATNPEFGMYYASIDPVSEGKTTSSESLVSIYIMKNAIEVTREGVDGMETFIERDKVVAYWCGRFDDINKTHERLEMMIEWYNAWTLVENNISLFIMHMINKKKQKYLIPKSQMLFLKDIGSNANVYQEYGWKNTGTLFSAHLLSYVIEYVKEELHVDTKTDGEIVRITYGIERIPDPMLLKEMSEYQHGLNVDRLVSFAALVAFMKIQQSNRGYSKRFESSSNKHLDKSEKISKLVSPFRHMGGNGSGMGRIKRSAFKNLK